MKIVIAGAGEVGTHLARLLSSEDIDIVLIDENEKKLMDSIHHMEVLPITGSPTMISTLENANVTDADLFVAVLPDESANIMSCLFAKKLGAKQTIARINNHEYLNPTNASFFEDLGVDSMIYPEELAANEIAMTVKYPWVRQYAELISGSFAVFAVKVREGAPIIGKALKDISSSDTSKTYHVVAIKRDVSTIIPKGDTIIQNNDLLYFTAITSSVDEVRQLCGKEDIKVKKMVIMGASPIALRTIAKVSSDIEVILVDNNKDKVQFLIDKMPNNVTVYRGDGRDSDIIEEIGLSNAQVFVALTENSETNVLACFAAKRYNVAKTIAKEENIDYIALAYRLDIGTLINKKILAAGYISRMLWGQELGSTASLSLINNSEVSEITLSKDSKLIGKSMKNIELGDNITIGGMIRNGIATMVHGDTVFQPYDHIVVFYHGINLSKLNKIFI